MKNTRISASETEVVLQEHSGVIELCIPGIRGQKVGEGIKAFVVLKKDVNGKLLRTEI